MYLDVLSENPFGTNCWIVGAEGRDDALVVDPGFEADRIVATLREAGRRPAAVLATHGHVDHVGAAAELCGPDVPFYIHEADELALTDPMSWGSNMSTYGMLGVAVDSLRPAVVRTVVEGDLLQLAGFEIEVVHTPGHTPGSVCFRLREEVFTGDLVFRGAIGRYDFPNSSARDMFASLRRFLSLPDLEAYPGHGEATSVALERATNPFLRQLA